MSVVADFYRGFRRTGNYNNEKTFDEWMLATDREWAECHCLIQWLFPLVYRSPNAPDAYLDLDNLEAMKTGPMQAKLRRAFMRFCEFLHFNIHNLNFEDYTQIAFSEKSISRVLASTRLLGLEAKGLLLLKGLLQDPYTSDHPSMRHWKDAGLGPEWSFASNDLCLREISKRKQQHVIVIQDD